MEIVPFENLKVTTRTIIAELRGEIYTIPVFNFLPVVKILLPTEKKSKSKIPHFPIPGSVLSIRCRDVHGNVYSRGVPKNKAFKNSVTLDISTVIKNSSIKVCPKKLQICGAASLEDGINAANLTLTNIKHLEDKLVWVQNNPEKTQEIIKWLKENTKGEPVEIDCTTLNPETLTPENQIQHFKLSKPSKLIPEEFNQDIASWLLSLIDDFQYYDDYCMKLDYLTNVRSVISSKELSISNAGYSMLNYNYKLGFEVDRDALHVNIDGVNGFMAVYDNALKSYVTIVLPYDLPENSFINKKKKKVPHHTFLVYRSGSVTQSGPGEELMREAYYLFMNTIKDLYPFIYYDPNRTEIKQWDDDLYPSSSDCIDFDSSPNMIYDKSPVNYYNNDDYQF